MADKAPGCFDARFIGLAAVGASLVAAAAFFGRWLPPRSAGRFAVAIGQAAATAVVILFPLFQMRRLDELQRRIQLEAFAVAFFATGVIGTTVGFLEAAGMPRFDWGAWIWPVMAGLWAAGLFFSARRYR